MPFLNLSKIKKSLKILNPKWIKNKLTPPNIDTVSLQGLHFKKLGFINKINNTEILILGSSHGDFGFNPLFFDQISYNLCSASQDLFYSYKLYEKFYKQMPNLQTIMVFYSVFSPGFELGKTVEYPICSFYKLLFDIPYNSSNKSYKQIEKRCIKELSKQLIVPENYSGFNNPQQFFTDDYGVANRVKTHLRENQRKTNQTEYINKIYDISKSLNHGLIIVIPPARSDYKTNLPDSSILFEELYKIVDNKFKILNFYDSNYFINDDFGDFDHLNSNGAKKLTQKIRECINNDKLS